MAAGDITRSRSLFVPDYSGTDDISVFLPNTRTTGKIPVLFCHGFLGGATEVRLRDRSDTADDIKALTSAGLPVCAADFDGVSTWGRDAAWGKVATTLTWMNTNHGTRTDKALFIGDSMGALTFLNHGWRFPSTVAAGVLRVPVVALETFRNRNTGVFGTNIEDAYGGMAAYTAALPTHDPSNANNIATMRGSFGPRVKAFYAISDPLIPPAEITDFMYKIGGQAQSVVGGHAEGADHPVSDLVSWLLQFA